MLCEAVRSKRLRYHKPVQTMNKHSILVMAALATLCMPVQMHAQGRGSGQGQRPTQDTMHVIRVALREYSRGRPDQRLILTPRSRLDSKMIARFGSTLHMADPARARIPTRVSVKSVVFQGDSVVDIFIEDKKDGKACYALHRIVLGRSGGSTQWVKWLGAEEEHVCNP